MNFVFLRLVHFFRKVHITRQTLDLLEDQYFFELGTEMAKNDPVLSKNGIETYLISPQYYGYDSIVRTFKLLLNGISVFDI